MHRITASKVGVHTDRSEPGRLRLSCARCGLVRMVRQDRPISDLCQTCQWVEPWWGTVPFEEMPTDDSNTCAFDEPYVSRQTARRREKRARNRED